MPKSETDLQDLQDLLYKLKHCITCSCLHVLEEEFNKCGLSLQTTTKSRMVLCKIKNGKPHCKEFMKDYIFIGTAEEDRELSKRAVECIMEFVENASSGFAEVKHETPKWQDGISLYGKVIVVNEDVEAVAGDVVMMD